MAASVAGWIADVVGEELASRGLSALKPGWRFRLARTVARDFPDVSARVIRRVIRASNLGAKMVQDPTKATSDYKTALEEATRRGQLTGQAVEPDEAAALAERLTTATMNCLLTLLKPGQALSVARTDFVNRLDRIERGIGDNQRDYGIDEYLSKLPPGGEGPLRQMHQAAPRAAVTLATAIIADEDGPGPATARLIESRPDFVREGPATTWVALAEIASGYGQNEAAVVAFENAAQRGAPDPSRWLARASLAALAAGQEESASRLQRAAAAAGNSRLVDIARAAAEQNLEQLLEATEGATPEMAEYQLLLGYRQAALASLGQFDQAIEAGRAWREACPRAATPLIKSARIQLSRVDDGSIPLPMQATRDAISWCEQARELRREWRGDSAEATALLCRASIMQKNWSGCLRYGLEPPRGEALQSEAEDEDVRVVVGMAAITVGDLALASSIRANLQDPFERLHLGSLVARQEGRDANSLELSRQAAEVVGSEDQRFALMMEQASLGEWPIDGWDDLRTQDETRATLVQAMSEASRGERRAAIERLRPLAATSRRVVALLSMTLHEDGDLAGATETLEEGFSRHSDPDFLVRVAKIHLQENDWQATEDSVARGLTLVTAESPSYAELKLIGLDVALAQEDWDLASQRASAILVETQDDDALWAHLGALYRGMHPGEAVRVLNEYPEASPRNATEAQLWLALRQGGEPSSQTVVDALSLAGEYEDDEVIVGLGLAIALSMSTAIKLDTAVVTKFTDLSNRFFERFPDSEILRRVSFDDLDQLSDQLRAMLEPGEAQYQQAVQLVQRSTGPQGLVSAATGRTYSEALLRRAARGMLMSRSRQERSAELEAIQEARNREVVVDLSVLSTHSLVPSRWDWLRQFFPKIHVHPGTRLDALQGATALSGKSTETLGWNTVEGRPVFTNISIDEAEMLATRARWMEQRTEELAVTGGMVLENYPELSVERFAGWLGSLDLAQRLDLPLLVDDVGLQRLAEAAGVSTFGSISLMDWALGQEALSVADAQSFRNTLMHNWAVDLDASAEEIRVLAEEANWQGGLASFQFSVARSWDRANESFELLRELLARVWSVAPDALLAWVADSLRGLAKTGSWEEIAPQLTSYSIWLSGYQPATFVGSTQLALLVGSEFGVPAVFEKSCAMVARQLELELGDLGTPQFIRMIDGLEDKYKGRALKAALA